MKYAQYLKKFYTLSAQNKVILICCYLLSAFSAFIILLPLKSYYKILTINPSSNIKQDNSKIYVVLASMKIVKKIAIWNCSCLNQVISLKILSYIFGVKSTVKLTVMDHKYESAKAHASITFTGQIEFLPITLRKSYIQLCIN